MPVIKSAKKKLRVDRKRQSANKKDGTLIDILIKKAKKQATEKNIQAAFKAIDKGVKKGIYHKNKGARLKSNLSKLNNKKQGALKTKVITRTKKSSKK